MPQPSRYRPEGNLLPPSHFTEPFSIPTPIHPAKAQIKNKNNNPPLNPPPARPRPDPPRAPPHSRRLAPQPAPVPLRAKTSLFGSVWYQTNRRQAPPPQAPPPPPPRQARPPREAFPRSAAVSMPGTGSRARSESPAGLPALTAPDNMYVCVRGYDVCVCVRVYDMCVCVRVYDMYVCLRDMNE